MNTELTYRKATMRDLNTIVTLLVADELGKTRESSNAVLDPRYIEAFEKINSDSNQYLIIIELNTEIVGTCHLTFMPSLTFHGSTRMQIEAVRVKEKHRGKGFGEWMMKEAIAYGQSNGASIIQLTTNKQRTQAKKFYENLGFEATHEGMKLYLPP